MWCVQAFELHASFSHYRFLTPCLAFSYRYGHDMGTSTVLPDEFARCVWISDRHAGQMTCPVPSNDVGVSSFTAVHTLIVGRVGSTLCIPQKPVSNIKRNLIFVCSQLCAGPSRSEDRRAAARVLQGTAAHNVKGTLHCQVRGRGQHTMRLRACVRWKH